MTPDVETLVTAYVDYARAALLDPDPTPEDAIVLANARRLVGAIRRASTDPVSGGMGLLLSTAAASTTLQLNLPTTAVPGGHACDVLPGSYGDIMGQAHNAAVVAAGILAGGLE